MNRTHEPNEFSILVKPSNPNLKARKLSIFSKNSPNSPHLNNGIGKKTNAGWSGTGLVAKNDDIFSSPVFLSTTLLKKCVGRRPSSLPGQRITLLDDS